MTATVIDDRSKKLIYLCNIIPRPRTGIIAQVYMQVNGDLYKKEGSRTSMFKVHICHEVYSSSGTMKVSCVERCNILSGYFDNIPVKDLLIEQTRMPHHKRWGPAGVGGVRKGWWGRVERGMQISLHLAAKHRSENPTT